jgi:TRAP-type C4-dicarboxylate transport system permease small subunit
VSCASCTPAFALWFERGAGVSGKSKLNAAMQAIDRATLVLACFGLLGMAIVQGWQVFARYVLNDSPSWTEPVALLFMSTTMMFGAAAGVRANRHFGFFILVESVGPRLRMVLLAIARLIAAGVGLMLATWGLKMLVDAWDYPIAGAPLPQGLVYLPMSLGGLLIAIFAIERLVVPEIAADARGEHE